MEPLAFFHFKEPSMSLKKIFVLQQKTPILKVIKLLHYDIRYFINKILLSVNIYQGVKKR